MFERVTDELEKRGLRVGIIEGKTPHQRRLDVIEQFAENAPPRTALDAVCVSLRAGGVGIDLSAGRFVYLLDSW